MENNYVLIFKIATYFALIPIVFRVLLSIDISKLFKKNKIGEIKIAYLFLTIIISKIVGDFFNDIMDLVRIIFGLN